MAASGPTPYHVTIAGVTSTVTPPTAGGSAAQAYAIPALNSAGVLDTSFLPASAGGTGGGTNAASGVIRNDGSNPGNYVIS